MTKWMLVLFCLSVLTAMTVLTTLASLDRSVLRGGVGLWPDPWFVATLADAYFGFLTFYLWLSYKEPTWLRRVIWLVAILSLGNFAMAGYLLWQVLRLRPFTIESLLLKRETTKPIKEIASA